MSNFLKSYSGYHLEPKPEFSTPRYNSNELIFLNKNIYSYPNEENLKNSTPEERALLIDYYTFLNETYFNGGSNIQLDGKVNDILFSYEHYSKIANKTVEMQTYLLKNLSTNYNRFKTYINTSLVETENRYNKILIDNKSNYENNINVDDNRAFDLVTRKELSPLIIQELERYEKDEKNGVEQIQVLKEMPTKIKNHVIILG